MAINLPLEAVDQPGGRAILISIKPKYASMILTGEKTVELRRNWPSQRVGVLVLYASSPEQKLVGLAYVEKVIKCDLDSLWNIASTNGGGVTYKELKAYLAEKPQAFGVIINRVKVADIQLDPKTIFEDFTPPQSLSFISPTDFQRITQRMFPTECNV